MSTEQVVVDVEVGDVIADGNRNLSRWLSIQELLWISRIEISNLVIFPLQIEDSTGIEEDAGCGCSDSSDQKSTPVGKLLFEIGSKSEEKAKDSAKNHSEDGHRESVREEEYCPEDYLDFIPPLDVFSAERFVILREFRIIFIKEFKASSIEEGIEPFAGKNSPNCMKGSEVMPNRQLHWIAGFIFFGSIFIAMLATLI